MRHLYYSQEPKNKSSQTPHGRALNEQGNPYRVAGATDMSTEELVEAIRGKIQEVLLSRTNNTHSNPS